MASSSSCRPSAAKAGSFRVRPGRGARTLLAFQVCGSATATRPRPIHISFFARCVTRGLLSRRGCAFQVSIPMINKRHQAALFPRAPATSTRFVRGSRRRLQPRSSFIVRRIPAKDPRHPMGPSPASLLAIYGQPDAPPGEALDRDGMVAPVSAIVGSAGRPRRRWASIFAFGTFGGWPAFAPAEFGGVPSELINMPQFAAAGRRIDWIHIPTLDPCRRSFLRRPSPVSKPGDGPHISRNDPQHAHAAPTAGGGAQVRAELRVWRPYCGFGRTPPEQLPQLLEDHLQASRAPQGRVARFSLIRPLPCQLHGADRHRDRKPGVGSITGTVERLFPGARAGGAPWPGAAHDHGLGAILVLQRPAPTSTIRSSVLSPLAVSATDISSGRSPAKTAHHSHLAQVAHVPGDRTLADRDDAESGSARRERGPATPHSAMPKNRARRSFAAGMQPRIAESRAITKGVGRIVRLRSSGAMASPTLVGHRPVTRSRTDLPPGSSRRSLGRSSKRRAPSANIETARPPFSIRIGVHDADAFDGCRSWNGRPSWAVILIARGTAKPRTGRQEPANGPIATPERAFYKSWRGWRETNATKRKNSSIGPSSGLRQPGRKHEPANFDQRIHGARRRSHA